MRVQFVILTLYACLWTSRGQFISNEFEFENLKGVDNNEPKPWNWRSEAANLKTLRLARPGQKAVTLTLCSKPAITGRPVRAYIENVRYSNDGPSDKVFVTINNIGIASFETVPYWNWGHHWNVFQDTGRVGRRFTMVRGNYRMKLRARTDEYGLELDKIDIKTLNQEPGVNIICRASFRDNN